MSQEQNVNNETVNELPQKIKEQLERERNIESTYEIQTRNTDGEPVNIKLIKPFGINYQRNEELNTQEEIYGKSAGLMEIQYNLTGIKITVNDKPWGEIIGCKDTIKDSEGKVIKSIDKMKNILEIKETGEKIELGVNAKEVIPIYKYLNGGLNPIIDETLAKNNITSINHLTNPMFQTNKTKDGKETLIECGYRNNKDVGSFEISKEVNDPKNIEQLNAKFIPIDIINQADPRHLPFNENNKQEGVTITIDVELSEEKEYKITYKSVAGAIRALYTQALQPQPPDPLTNKNNDELQIKQENNQYITEAYGKKETLNNTRELLLNVNKLKKIEINQRNVKQEQVVKQEDPAPKMKL